MMTTKQWYTGRLAEDFTQPGIEILLTQAESQAAVPPAQPFLAYTQDISCAGSFLGSTQPAVASQLTPAWDHPGGSTQQDNNHGAQLSAAAADPRGAGAEQVIRESPEGYSYALSLGNAAELGPPPVLSSHLVGPVSQCQKHLQTAASGVQNGYRSCSGVLIGKAMPLGSPQPPGSVVAAQHVPIRSGIPVATGSQQHFKQAAGRGSQAPQPSSSQPHTMQGVSMGGKSLGRPPAPRSAQPAPARHHTDNSLVPAFLQSSTMDKHALSGGPGPGGAASAPEPAVGRSHSQGQATQPQHSSAVTNAWRGAAGRELQGTALRVQSPSLDSLVLGNKRLSSHFQQSPVPAKVPRGPGDGLQQGAAVPGPAQADSWVALPKAHKSLLVEGGSTSQSRATSDRRPASGAAKAVSGDDSGSRVRQSHHHGLPIQSRSEAPSRQQPGAAAAEVVTEGAGGPQPAPVQQSVADLSALSISATRLPPASNAAKHAEGSGSKPTSLVTVRADGRAMAPFREDRPPGPAMLEEANGACNDVPGPSNEGRELVAPGSGVQPVQDGVPTAKRTPQKRAPRGRKVSGELWFLIQQATARQPADDQADHESALYPRRKRQPPPAFLSGPCDTCGTMGSRKWVAGPNGRGCLCTTCVEGGEEPYNWRRGLGEGLTVRRDTWALETSNDCTVLIHAALAGRFTRKGTGGIREMGLLLANRSRPLLRPDNLSERQCRLYSLGPALQPGPAAGVKVEPEHLPHGLQPGQVSSTGPGESSSPPGNLEAAAWQASGRGAKDQAAAPSGAALEQRAWPLKRGLAGQPASSVDQSSMSPARASESPEADVRPSKRSRLRWQELSRAGQVVAAPPAGGRATHPSDGAAPLVREKQPAHSNKHGRSSVQPSSSAVYNEERFAGGNRGGPLMTKALEPTNKKTTKETTKQTDLEVAVQLGILDSPSRGVPDSQQWRTWAAIRKRSGPGFHPDRNRTAEDIIRHGFP